MIAYLDVVSREVKAHAFVIMIMEQADWHKALRVPYSLLILFLGARSPEIITMERSWHYTRNR